MSRKRRNEISLDETSQDHSYAQLEDESSNDSEESSSSSSSSSVASFPTTPRTRAEDEEIQTDSRLSDKIPPEIDQDTETGVKVKRRKPRTRKYITAEFVESDSEGHRTYEKEKIVVKKKDYLTKSEKCDKCEYTSTRGNVKKHSRVHTGTGSSKKGLTCPEDGCERKYQRMRDLDHHLAIDHQRELITETIYMADEAELRRWVRGIKETESFYYLVGRRNGNNGNNGDIWYCSLSSNNYAKKSTATGLRKLKPSIKSDRRRVCTSRLVISEHEGGLKVDHHKTHSGHSMEKPQRDGLTLAQKRDAAKMILDGVSKSVVLDRLKVKYVIEGKNACKLTDIYNIAKKIQATQEKERRQQEELERDNFTFYTYPELGEPMNEDLDIELNLKLADDYYSTAREFATNPKLAEELACRMKALVESLKQPAELEPDPDPVVEVPVITNVVSMQNQPNSTQKKWTSPRKKTKTKKAQAQSNISTIDLNCNLFEDLIFM